MILKHPLFKNREKSMKTLKSIDKEDVHDFLSKGWLTHDGMWFYQTQKEFGIEKACQLNRAAIQAMSPIEVERTKRVLGFAKARIETFEDLKNFMYGALEIVLPVSVRSAFNLSVTSENTLHWEWSEQNCFAYKGMERIGVIDKYICGVIYRIECWLNTLGVAYTINPKIEACIMYEKGSCSGDLTFYFEE
jgi:hypothetical protein